MVRVVAGIVRVKDKQFKRIGCQNLYTEECVERVMCSAVLVLVDSSLMHCSHPSLTVAADFGMLLLLATSSPGSASSTSEEGLQHNRDESAGAGRSSLSVQSRCMSVCIGVNSFNASLSDAADG